MSTLTEFNAAQTAVPTFSVPELPPPLARMHGVMVFSDRFDVHNSTSRDPPVPWNAFKAPDTKTQNAIWSVRDFEADYYAGKVTPPLSVELAGAILEVTFRLAQSRYIVGLLRLIDAALHENYNLSNLFIIAAGGDHKHVLAPFVVLLENCDEFVQMLASRIMIAVAMFATIPLDPSVYGSLLDMIHTQLLKVSDPPLQDFYFQLLHPLMGVSQLRDFVYNYNDGLMTKDVMGFLSLNFSAQWQYNALFIIWQWTFNEEIRNDLQPRYSVIPKIVDIIRCSLSEKVLRLAWEILECLVNTGGNDNAKIMIACRLHELLVERKKANSVAGDSATSERMMRIFARLDEALYRLSTLDQYISEVLSGKFQWTPAHTSDSFWEKYAEYICKNDSGHLIKLLAKHLSTLNDPACLCIVAHDLGEISKFYPDGRRLMTNLGIKHRLMCLTDHADEEVKYHALVACQVFMTINW